MLPPSIERKFAPRRDFNDARGRELLSQLCLNFTQLASSYHLALGACAALLDTVHGRTRPSPHTFRLELPYTGVNTLLSAGALTSLEILKPRSPNGPCLFSLLSKYIATVGGRRFLHSQLAMPPSLPATVSGRQDAVQEFLTRPQLCEAIHTCLQSVGPLSSLVSHLSSLVTKCDSAARLDSLRSGLNFSPVNLLTQLNQTLASTRALAAQLSDVRTEALVFVRRALSAPEIESVQAILDSSLGEPFTLGVAVSGQASLLAKRVTAATLVRTQYDTTLLCAQETIRCALARASELLQDATEQFPELGLRLSYTGALGLHFTGAATRDDVTDEHVAQALSQIAHQPVSAGSARGDRVKFTCTSPELSQVSSALNTALSDAGAQTAAVAGAIGRQLRQFAPTLEVAADALSLIDYLQALAQYGLSIQRTGRSFCFPRITSDDTAQTAITALRPPLLEVEDPQRTCSNDVVLSAEHPLLFLTGENNCGKSAYLSSIGQSAVLTQLGAPIPATAATWKPVCRIFALATSEPVGTAGLQSAVVTDSFASNLQSLAQIATDGCEGDLVLCDEPGRMCLEHDGLAVTWASLIAAINAGAVCVAATHFPSVSLLPSLDQRVQLAHFTSPESPTPYRLREGKLQSEGYGVRLAGMLGLPPSLIADATRLLQQISQPISDDQSVSDYLHSLLTAATDRSVSATEFAAVLRCRRIPKTPVQTKEPERLSTPQTAPTPQIPTLEPCLPLPAGMFKASDYF